jgi:eukaryotic-like serine/threonine-protein kinase
MTALKPGQLLRCVESKASCRVDGLLGEGGQGEVYRVTLDGLPYALKWYNDVVLRVDRTLRRRLEVAIDHGAPSSEFLWPFELVTLPDGTRLGYLMRLRSPEYLKIQSVLAEQVRPTFRVLAMTALRLTNALLALHSKGLVYQDLNAGNVFFDPDTGAIEICDNDNVDIDGAPSVMGGVWEFQAPEVVLRQAGPSRATDLHSLAVMLFRLLHIGHPLIGRCELAHHNLTDQSVLRRIYGTEARFVFDPASESNRPLPDRHGPVLGHWAIYPQSVRDLFVRAFTEGLYDPSHGRVQETEWRRAMSQLHDTVETCSHCRAQNFYDPQRIVNRQTSFQCWRCGGTLASTPPRIGIRRPQARTGEQPSSVVVLEPGAFLYGSHIGQIDTGAAVADVVAEPALSLRNLGQTPWHAVLPQGASSVEIVPGEAVTIAAGVRVNFGRAIGELKC